MPDHDPLSDRRRTAEDDYFRKKDRQLIEKIRAAAEADHVRRGLIEQTGLADPELLRQLQELGFTPETVKLLPLVPVIEVAWAEGNVSPAERQAIEALARARGIDAGGAADALLQTWLARKPGQDVLTGANRLIAALIDGSSGALNLTPDDLIRQCESIASASGGFLGIAKISPEERRHLERIAATFGPRKSP